jgi:hypothetical protein
MQAAFCEASQVSGKRPFSKVLRLAGSDVPISIVGETLATIVSNAFSHLLRSGEVVAKCGGDVTSIMLWDQTVVGTPAPAAPLNAEWQNHATTSHLSAYDGLRYVREERPESVIWLDRATGQLVAMFNDAREFLLYEKARPLSRHMSELCYCLGAQDAHAAAVSSGDAAVLIVGGSGRGKTTTSLDCLFNGLRFLGDDSVALTECECRYSVHSLYASARADPRQIARWQAFKRFWTLPGQRDDKALLMPLEVPGLQMATQARVVAIIVPCIRDGPVRKNAVRRSEAFHALVRDSVENRRNRLSGDRFQKFARLTQQLPSYALQIGRDPLAVSIAIAGIIEDHRQ